MPNSGNDRCRLQVRETERVEEAAAIRVEEKMSALSRETGRHTKEEEDEVVASQTASKESQ